MSSWKTPAFVLAASLGIVGSLHGDEVKAVRIWLLEQTFIVDDAATLLPNVQDKQLPVEEVSEHLSIVLKGNNNIFARLESIRRAATQILLSNDEWLRKTEAKQLLGVLKDGYVKHGGKLGRRDAELSNDAPNSSAPITADKVDPSVLPRTFIRADLAYGISLLAATKLIDEADLADLKLCKEYLQEAAGIQPMPELSFCSALLCSTTDTRPTDAEQPIIRDLRFLEFKRHVEAAVRGSVPGDLIDRNLVHCFGLETVRTLRGDSPKEPSDAPQHR